MKERWPQTYALLKAWAHIDLIRAKQAEARQAIQEARR